MTAVSGVPAISEVEVLRARVDGFARTTALVVAAHGEVVGERDRLRAALARSNDDYADLRVDFEALAARYGALMVDRDNWQARYFTLESRGTL